MIISTLDELRLFSPSNAVDNIESLTGFINSSEQDFLKEKLGTKLYDSLCAYYSDTISANVGEYISSMQTGAPVPAYARLLYLCQKAVVYDALSRAVSLQAISINGMGVNVASNDNYKAADSQAITDFKKACVKESHSAINEILQTLEEWAVKVAEYQATVDAGNEPTEVEPLAEETEIVALWKTSRYYFKVATLIIPSAAVLQDYYNIYSSREKFIQMLPELRYIQEDILVPMFGEDVVEHLASLPWTSGGTNDKHIMRMLVSLRKIMAKYLESRLASSTDPRSESARNEAVKITNRLVAYMQLHQPDFSDEFLEVFKTSPLYTPDVDPEEKPKPATPKFVNNDAASVMFVTPGII